MLTTKQVRKAVNAAAKQVGVDIVRVGVTYAGRIGQFKRDVVHGNVDANVWFDSDENKRRYLTFFVQDGSDVAALTAAANALLGTEAVRVTAEGYVRATAFVA